jgi:hypothetical protein
MKRTGSYNSPLRKCGNNSTMGGVLFTTLLLALTAGLVILFCLTLVSWNQQIVARSQCWNGAMAVAEAGIEEALAHLQENYPSNMLTAGWSEDGTNWSQKRDFGDGYYNVTITMSTNPVISSQGYSKFPFQDIYLSRSVRVQTVWTSYVFNAIATKEQIRLNGFTVGTDSYDSGDPSYSTPTGQYDPTKTKDGGDIRTNSRAQDAFDAGNSKIKGHVATGKGTTIKVGAGGVIGSTAWHAGGNKGLESGWSDDDADVPMDDVVQPYTSGSTPASGIVGGTTYTYILGNGNYKLNSFGGQVLVNGNATLLVNNSVSFTGGDFIYIAPGASLKLYVAAPSADIGGSGVINPSGLASAFSYYGLPSNTSLSISGGGQLAGFIYAPNADLKISGGGDVYGATMTRTLTLGGNAQFHFDEALKRVEIFRMLGITGWNEI